MKDSRWFTCSLISYQRIKLSISHFYSIFRGFFKDFFNCIVFLTIICPLEMWFFLWTKINFKISAFYETRFSFLSHCKAISANHIYSLLCKAFLLEIVAVSDPDGVCILEWIFFVLLKLQSNFLLVSIEKIVKGQVVWGIFSKFFVVRLCCSRALYEISRSETIFESQKFLQICWIWYGAWYETTESF